MLDTLLTADHLAVKDMCGAIATDVVAPNARQAEADGAVPPNVWKALVETGLTQAVDEKLGGSGVPDTLTHVIAAESLAYGDPGIALAALWNGAVAFLLGQHGGKTHRDQLDQLLSDVDLRAGLAVYEGYGRGPDESTTTIERSAVGDVRISGRKVAVPFAGTAAFYLVVGVDPATGGLRLATVQADTPGVTVAPYDGALALQAAALGTVGFDVTVPESALVGGVETDGASLLASIQRVRLLVAAAQLGTGQRAVDYASKYATERIAFGQPIAAFQGISFPLAEAQMRLAQLRLEIEEAASRLDLDDFKDHSDAIGAALAYAAEIGPEAGRTGVQTLGGHGFIKDHPVEIWYRSSAALSALDFDPHATPFTAAL